MQLLSLSSSSKGNSHILIGDNEALLLDCGITFWSYNYLLQKYNVVGALVTHCHGDHIKALQDKSIMLGYAKVYANAEVIASTTLNKYQYEEINTKEQFKIGQEWLIKAFTVPHDALNYNFLIYHIPSKRKIVYITDAGHLTQFTFHGIDTYITECNYSTEWDNTGSKEVYNRVHSLLGHISIEELIEFLGNNKDDSLKNIVLVHISHKFNDYLSFQSKVQNKFPQTNVIAVNNRLHKDETQLTQL
ncbi:MAG: MBL fold metallo-hydrolase [Bacteroidaceae bacterium]